MKCVNIHHAGLWVRDMDGMISFLTGIMGFRFLTRNPRGVMGPGERALVHAGDHQVLELLTEPDVVPRPDFPVHPVGHVAGIPHLCLRVTDLPAWREKLATHGYTVSAQFSEKGFMDSELGQLRLTFFVGPEGVGFELFEFENEYAFEDLSPSGHS
jgi:catechol 2,3-dioxygenase-like lactoylglutathione lyase family enzyme